MAQALPIDRIEDVPAFPVRSVRLPQAEAGDAASAPQGTAKSISREAVMVGDRASDIEAGRAAGCRTVFIDLDYASEAKPADADFAVRSLAEAADIILDVMPNDPGAAMRAVNGLKVKIFADGADLDGILEMAGLSYIKGFTTNPTLMRKAGVTDYEAFARKLLEAITRSSGLVRGVRRRLSGMIAQARAIASWGRNVNVKVPVMNTKGEFAGPVLQGSAAEGVMLNVTAIMTPEQVSAVAEVLDHQDAGDRFGVRRAYRGYRRRSGAAYARLQGRYLRSRPKAELLWASPRELLNIFQADEIGCDIITVHQRHDCQARSGRQGPRRIFARNGADVPSRRRRVAFSIDLAKSARLKVVGIAHGIRLVRTMFWSPAAPAIAAACWCRSCSIRATRSRSTISMFFGDDFLPKDNPQSSTIVKGDIRDTAQLAAIPRATMRSSALPASPMMRASNSTRSSRPRSISMHSSRWWWRPRRPA